MKKKKWNQHTFYNPVEGVAETISGNKELDITFQEPSNHAYFMQRFWDVLHEYVVKDMNFSWYNGWRGYSNIRYNMYKKTRIMAEHCDHIHSLFDHGVNKQTGIPILSILAILNDDYVGGELIFWQDTEIKVSTGDILVFPSNFLYPHRVEAITKGTRFSAVSWTW